MKKNKKKWLIIATILIVVHIGMMVFMTFEIIDDLKNNAGSTAQTNLNLEKKAKELYDYVVKDLIFYEVSEGNIADFTLNDIASIVLAVSKDSDYIQNLCGTPLENELINEGIISKKGEGQIDCESNAIMKVDEFEKIALGVLGEDYEIGLETRTKGDGLFEYSHKNEVVRLYYTGDNCSESKYAGFLADNKFLTIKVEETGCNKEKLQHHEVRFKIDEDNFYLYEVIYDSTKEYAEKEGFIIGNTYSKKEISAFIDSYNIGQKINDGFAKFIEVDIDEDSQKDLIVTNGDKVDEASAVGFFFRNNNSKYIYIGSSGVGHSIFSKEKGKDYINHLYGQMGYWTISKYSIENNRLKIEQIKSGELKDGGDYPTIPGEILKVR